MRNGLLDIDAVILKGLQDPCSDFMKLLATAGNKKTKNGRFELALEGNIVEATL